MSSEFFRGHELCQGNGLPAEHGKRNALVPSIVCLAFSIELGLKAIILATKSSVKSHKLVELFNLLSDEDQNVVIRNAVYDNQRFDEQLSEVSNAFVEWRYIHEQTGLHGTSLQFLLLLHGAVEVVVQRNSQLHRDQLRRRSE